jgi:hypothetical protein
MFLPAALKGLRRGTIINNRDPDIFPLANSQAIDYVIRVAAAFAFLDHAHIIGQNGTEVKRKKCDNVSHL